MKIHIRTLGALQISGEDGPISGIKTRKVTALAVYLCSQAGTMISREHLQGLLWGESERKQAAASLRQALSGLRRAFPEEMIRQDGMAVGWHATGDYCLDIDNLDEVVEEGETGEFLHGFVVRKAPQWDEWLLSMRERLRLALLERYLQRGQAALDEDPDAALIYLQRALEIEPWQESTHRLVITAHWLNGDSSAALAQYERCVQILKNDLGVSPSSETEAMVRRIRDGASLYPTNLPDRSGDSPFVGRRVEIEKLGGLVQKNRLVTLTGLGGMGKTRTALEIARNVLPHFSDGVYFIDLVGEDPGSLATVIASSIGQESDGRETLAQLSAFVEERVILLLLDNFEPFLSRPGPVRLLQDLLDATHTLHLLVTSRERLNLRIEQVFPLSGLDLDDESEADRGESAAFSLFVHMARRADSSFNVSARNRADIARICRMVEGMPLAIELAAAWTRVLSCADIAGEIEQDLSLLHSSHSDRPDRQTSLERVLDAGWRRLTRSEQVSLRGLTIFRGSFARRAAAEVADVPLAQLAAFVDKSLLARHGRNRFRFHERLRQYILTQTPVSEREMAKIGERHASYYAQMLTDALPQLQGAGQLQAVSELGQDLANVQAAWRRLESQAAYDRLVTAIEPLHLFYQIRSWLRAGYDFFAQAEAELTQGSGSASPDEPPDRRRYRAHLQLQQGAFLQLMDRFTEAETLLIRGMETLSSLGDANGRLFALNNLGAVAANLADMEGSAAYFEEALEVAQELGDRFREGGILNNLGVLSELTGGDTEAMAWYDKSIAIHRALDDQHGLAIALNNRGTCAERLGLDDVAWNMYSESLSIRRRLDDRVNISQTLNNLALIALDRQQWDRAEELLDESFRINRESGKEHRQAYSRLYLSQAKQGRGDHEQAIELAQEALAILEKLENREGIIAARTVLGEALYGAGAVGEGRRLLLRALDLAVEDGRKDPLAAICYSFFQHLRPEQPGAALTLLRWMEQAELTGQLRRVRIPELKAQLEEKLTNAEIDAQWQRVSAFNLEAMREWLHELLG